MKRSRVCRPGVDTLEGRIVLSFSLSSIWHSISASFGGPSNTTTTAKTLTPAQVQAQKAANAAHYLQVEQRLEAAREARLERIHGHAAR